MGNVYFVAADGAIKIGFSANVSKRMAQLQTGAACKLTLLAIYPGANRGIEKRLHEVFAQHRLEGEWFRDTRIIRKFAMLIAAGARPVDLMTIEALAELVRTSPDPARPRSVKDRNEKIRWRKETPIPQCFLGTPQEALIRKLDAMTRNPELPIPDYGKAHSMLRRALKGEIVDI